MGFSLVLKEIKKFSGGKEEIFLSSEGPIFFFLFGLDDNLKTIRPAKSS